MSWFSQNIGKILMGAGTVLSIIPAVGPLIGAPVIAAGAAMSANANGTQDTVTASANNLLAAISGANASSSAVNTSLTMSGITTWIKNNMLLVLAVAGGIILFVFKPFKHKRR
ncbi:MAG: hypothetical protein ABSA76_00965 [Bacteroidales bacterium]